MSESTCALCEMPTKSFECGSKFLVFCCKGCESVYQILEAKQELGSKFTHPIFQQALHYGLISNPALLKKNSSEAFERQKWVFQVDKMWCPACAALIALVLDSQKGILSCSVDYVTDLASIEFDPLKISKESIRKTIKGLGYFPLELEDPFEKPIEKKLTFRFAIAAFCAFNVMMFAYPLYATYFDWDLEELQPLLAFVSLFLTLPVMGYAGWPLYERMWVQLWVGYLGMETLIGVGTLAAFILSCIEMWKGTYHIYFDTISVLIAFLLLGKMVESKAKFSSKNALFRIHQTLPRKARRLEADGTTLFVPLKEIKLNDRLLVMGGERIVLDGVVERGEGVADESILTGEGKPIQKKKGDVLLAGSILINGRLEFRTTSIAENSTLSRVLQLVEQSLGDKSYFVSGIEQFVKWFTPTIFILAITLFLSISFFYGDIGEAIRRALSLLLIACPCAIGIAAPLVEARLLENFSDKGALVRNRALFYRFPNLTHFIFDKTGTVTEGSFTILKGLESLGRKELSLLKGLASQSLHPVSQAIAHGIEERAVIFDTIREIAGLGVEGEYQGKKFRLGSRRFASENGLLPPSPAGFETEAFFMSEQEIFTHLTLGDTLREEAFPLLAGLKGYQRILLSGDQRGVVEQVAKRLDFDAFIAEATPTEKQAYIAQLKSEGASVLMMGDGINDAPALAKADIGVSLVAASEISIQSSDLLLTSNRLSILLKLKEKTLQGARVIKQNLFWAFAYNVIGIGLASFGLLTPLFASFAMIISSLFVLCNARRV